MNNHYELLYLVSSNHTEDELEPIKQKVREVITKVEGNITFEDNLGKKRLAYPVEKNQQGYYLLTEFDLDGQNLEKLNTDLKLTGELLRHIVVKRKPSKQTNRLRLSDDAVAAAPVSETPAKPVTSEIKQEIKEEAPKPAATSEESKVSLEDLDEKLDEILDGDIM